MKEPLNRLIEKMPRCPICGKKAIIIHMTGDGFDFGYSGGCPSYRLNDGVHGITKFYDPEAPSVDGYSAKVVFDKWVKYCKMKARETE